MTRACTCACQGQPKRPWSFLRTFTKATSYGAIQLECCKDVLLNVVTYSLTEQEAFKRIQPEVLQRAEARFNMLATCHLLRLQTSAKGRPKTPHRVNFSKQRKLPALLL